jgi:hypothetical protein
MKNNEGNYGEDRRRSDNKSLSTSGEIAYFYCEFSIYAPTIYTEFCIIYTDCQGSIEYYAFSNIALGIHSRSSCILPPPLRGDEPRRN